MKNEFIVINPNIMAAVDQNLHLRGCQQTILDRIAEIDVINTWRWK